MDNQRIARVQQLRETMRSAKSGFVINAFVAIVGYGYAASRGSLADGWVAFVIAVGASFAAVVIAVALASYELEANLLEGPRTD